MRGSELPSSSSCRIIPTWLLLQDWVLHGLWPSKNHSIGPEDCNATAAFVLKPLIPLYDQLTIFWPNFETNTAFGSFWAHEWVKHGTCAQDIPELKGEFNFFNMPLQFRKKYDLFNALFEQNIAPSATKTFSHDQFTAALEAAFNERIEVYCSYSSRTKLHYVAEIRICMTKDLQLMECPAQSGNEMSSCPKGQNLMYPPVIVPKLNSGGEPNFKHRGSVRGSHRKSAWF